MAGKDGDGRRYPKSLDGVLKYTIENTKAEDGQASEFRPMTEEAVAGRGGSRPASGAGAGDRAPSPPPSGLQQARRAQDKALLTLGLYRYLIPEDGNCMFRAVASQLRLDQEKYSAQLRQTAVDWMAKHADELLAGGLLDDVTEIEEFGRAGVWPSQAALVALANELDINIAVIQGGDQGTLDIQHITPFETPAMEESEKGIILAYLYNGHYDGVVREPYSPNPDYKAWRRDCERDLQLSESVARELSEEREDVINHVAGSPVRPLEQTPRATARAVLTEARRGYSPPASSEYLYRTEDPYPARSSKIDHATPLTRGYSSPKSAEFDDAPPPYRDAGRHVTIERGWSGADVPYMATNGTGSVAPSAGKTHSTNTSGIAPPPYSLQREPTKVRIIPIRLLDRPSTGESRLRSGDHLRNQPEDLYDRYKKKYYDMDEDATSSESRLPVRSGAVRSRVGTATEIPVIHKTSEPSRPVYNSAAMRPSLAHRSSDTSGFDSWRGLTSGRASAFDDAEEMDISDAFDYLKPFRKAGSDFSKIHSRLDRVTSLNRDITRRQSNLKFV